MSRGSDQIVTILLQSPRVRLHNLLQRIGKMPGLLKALESMGITRASNRERLRKGGAAYRSLRRLRLLFFNKDAFSFLESVMHFKDNAPSGE